ncbi:hypothetical protein HPE56_13610 [Maribacter sp. ANRC-HE7]|uniref:RapA2 cadherin-like domain-containing protein n=1 Tax=Maribacter aquimaris TaxID=2737171 RepID=A0ABR7V4F6_9FLAO|nr:hypothetical protein [Maribacter aquimaris]MBD0778835.1 hypothetical protein [Maribacter aquimaris]
MNFKTLAPLKVFLLSIFIVSQFSCSKDSDLITDYVLSETQNTLDLSELILDDTFFINSRESITLDVLANDGFENVENVIITETSEPENGTVVINTDNTLTYTPETTTSTSAETTPDTPIETTPETTEEIEDTFTYTTEVVNEDETVSTGTGNVTVTSENKAPITGDNVYYVTITGKANNNGRSEATAWSIQHAFATAVAGDVVYVKAGNYASVNITSKRSGTSGNPIKFIGYNTTPGDITATNGPTYTKDDWLENGQDLPDNIMPHLEANPINQIPESADRGFVINHSHIELHNFMLSEYRVGIQVSSSNVILDNIIGFQFGNWSRNSNCWNNAGVYGCDNGTGYGIYTTKANNVNISNTLIIDAGLAAYFPTFSENINISWSEAYAYNGGNGSDYLFDYFNTSNSSITDCYAERTYKDEVNHRSRALIFQAASDNNILERFKAKNARIQVENSRNNVLRDVYSEGAQGLMNSGGLQLFGQSDNNLFINWEMTGEGIQFLGITGAENQRTPHTSSGDNNYFINFIIRDLPAFNGNALVSFHRLDAAGTNLTGGTNYIIGLTADNFPWIINANRAGTIHFYNSSFSNGTKATIDTYYSGYNNATGSYKATFTNCNDYNNAFPAIAGTNITTNNPSFKNIADNDFSLQPNSPLKDIGMDGSTLKTEAAYDILGKARGSNGGYDIGAYEY